MAAVMLNNPSVVIANYIGQWMWAILIALFLGPIVITWIISRFIEPITNIRDIILIIVTVSVFILTILSIWAAINFAFYYPAPLSEAQKNFLDMANQGWETGIAALCALVVSYWHSRRNDRDARR